MDTILQLVQQREAQIGLIIGAVLGLLLGLAIGWWWWPVEWTNSTPANLRSDFQSAYILWVAEQYAETGDLVWARSKLGVEYWKEGQLAMTLEQLAQDQGGEEAIWVRDMAQYLKAAPEAIPAEPEVSLWDRLRSTAMVCGVGLLVIALVGGGLFVFSRWRSQRAALEVEGRGVGIAERLAPAEGVPWEGDGPPLVQFPTTYKLGDDHYDPSFSIELENGEFMGECGVGISETIGVGAPNKVTAFEVWLFDKNDIRTVTKVLMSGYAFHDEALHAKLAPKGEPMLAKAGEDVILETKTLRVQVRIAEAVYGAGNLPPNSFFEKLTVDLSAWVKPGAEGASLAAEAELPIEPPTL